MKSPLSRQLKTKNLSLYHSLKDFVQKFFTAFPLQFVEILIIRSPFLVHNPATIVHLNLLYSTRLPTIDNLSTLLNDFTRSIIFQVYPSYNLSEFIYQIFHPPFFMPQTKVINKSTASQEEEVISIKRSSS